MTKEEILKELENVKQKEKDKKYFTGELNVYAMVIDVIDFINQQDKDVQRLRQSLKTVVDRYRTLDRKYTKLRKGNYYLKNERDNVLENNKYLREYIKAHEHSELVDKLNEMERTINSLDYELNDIYHPQPYKFEELKKGMWVWDSVEKCCFPCSPAISTDMAQCVTYNSFWYNDGGDEDEFFEEYEEFEEGRYYPVTKAMEYQRKEDEND